ncbi:resistance to congo red [Saccharomyces pastorianus]|nr:resistance to congo red [Saccharomyces pastorianus]
MYTALLNKRRRRIGRAPIRGTAWLTPPSYRQSQQQQTGTRQQPADDYVPEYTETANEHDLGYYDERGEFHPNDKVAPAPPVQELSSESVNSLERPPAAVVHQTNSSDMEDDLTRPNNRQVPVASDMGGQTQESLGVSGTQEITPPGRAKLNANQ